MSYEYMSGMGALSFSDLYKTNPQCEESNCPGGNKKATIDHFGAHVGNYSASDHGRQLKEKGCTGLCISAGKSYYCCPEGTDTTYAGLGGSRRQQLNRSCPSGSHETAVDVPSGPGMSFAFSREQALLDKGCTHLRTSSGPYIGSGATKYYCCPEQAVARPTQPSAVAQARQDAFQEAMLEQQMRLAEIERNAATAETPVTNGNGNGNGASAAVTPAAAEEEKYFGFTAQQLMLMGAGGVVLYMLLKK